VSAVGLVPGATVRRTAAIPKTDNGGLTVVAADPTLPGTLGIGLLSGAFLNPATFSIITDASDPDGVVTNVQFIANNVVLVGLCAVIFWGTYFPLISEALTGHEASVGPPWFDRYTVPLALILFQTVSTAINVYGHLGYEIYPRGTAGHWLGRWINTSVAHNFHHQTARHNYGFYFLFWDRLMGTNHPRYEQEYERVCGTSSRDDVAPETVGSLVPEGDPLLADPLCNLDFVGVRLRARNPVGTLWSRILKTQLDVIESGVDQAFETIGRKPQAGGNQICVQTSFVRGWSIRTNYLVVGGLTLGQPFAIIFFRDLIYDNEAHTVVAVIP